MSLFVSYTRSDEALVRLIREDLERLGGSVWMDHQIHGGESWWREIIQEVQRAEIFVFALSNHSWRSKPCRLELRYAEKLGIPVLPLQVGPLDSMFISLAERQIIDYRGRTADAVVRLAVALRELTARPVVLPDPLPDPPQVPFEYLYRIAALMGPDRITPEAQDSLIAQLRGKLKEEDDEVAKADIVKLLKELLGRGELTVRNAREIEDILVGVVAKSVSTPDGGATRLPPAGQLQPETVGVAEDVPVESSVDSNGSPADRGEAAGSRDAGSAARGAGTTAAVGTAAVGTAAVQTPVAEVPAETGAGTTPSAGEPPVGAEGAADAEEDRPEEPAGEERDPPPEPARRPVGTGTVPGWLADIVRSGSGKDPEPEQAPGPAADPDKPAGWWARQHQSDQRRPDPGPPPDERPGAGPGTPPAGQYRIAHPRDTGPHNTRQAGATATRGAATRATPAGGVPPGHPSPPSGHPAHASGGHATPPSGMPAGRATPPFGTPVGQATPASGTPLGPATPGFGTPAGRTASGGPRAVGSRRLAVVGGVLGAVGIPFLVVALAGDHDADSAALATLVLFVTALGLSLAVVAGTRRAGGSRQAIAVAVVGLVGALAYALSSWGAF